MSANEQQNDFLARRVAAFTEYEKLRDLLAKLRLAIIEDDEELPAYVVRLPFPQKDVERPRLVVPAIIESQAEARAYATDCICLTTYINNGERRQDPRSAIRCPGVLATSESTYELIEAVNVQKNVVDKAVQAIADRSVIRSREIRKAVPNFHNSHTTRMIHRLMHTPERVVLYWGSHSPKLVRRPVKRICEEIHADYELPPENWDIAKWHETLEGELAMLSGLNENEYLACREPIAPHPRANVYHYASNLEDGADPQTPAVSPASLPLVYRMKSALLPMIKPLGTLDVTYRRAERSDRKTQKEPLIKRLDLYRYKEEHRQFTEE